MTVTASIVVHKTPMAQLRKAVQCLLRSEVETVFIIDNSPGNELHEIAALSTKIKYIHTENRGFGAGHNTALREILNTNSFKTPPPLPPLNPLNPLIPLNQLKSPESADPLPERFHIVMNADVWWEGDIISPLAQKLARNPEIGLIAPKVFYPDGALQLTARMLPTPFDLFAKRFMPRKITKKRMERYLLASHDHDKELNCPYLLGSFMMFRVDALRECGVFDERFFMYPEDIDITRRIHERYTTLYWPKVSIRHEHAAASRHNAKMLRVHIVNMIEYFCKWGWIFDAKRRRYNRRLLSSLTPLPKHRLPNQRG